MESLRLYDYAASGNCYKVRLLLAQLERNHERVPIDIFAGDTLTDEYYEKNPARSTPVLQIGDSTYLPESNAILVYLADGTLSTGGRPARNCSRSSTSISASASSWSTSTRSPTSPSTPTPMWLPRPATTCAATAASSAGSGASSSSPASSTTSSPTRRTPARESADRPATSRLAFAGGAARARRRAARGDVASPG